MISFDSDSMKLVVNYKFAFSQVEATFHVLLPTRIYAGVALHFNYLSSRPFLLEAFSNCGKAQRWDV